MAEIQDWIGESLRWTLNSSFGLMQRYRAEDLDFISAYPATLDAPQGYGENEGIADTMAGLFRTEFGIACHGAETEFHASPYSLRFYSVVAGDAEDTSDAEGSMDAPPSAGTLPTCAMLRITVPTTWPLDDFCRRVQCLAGHLRLRWGAAGLTYSGWEVGQWYDAYMEAVYARARRYPGFDIGFYVTHMHDFHEQLRTINWLTFLGPAFVERLRDRGGKLEGASRVRVSPLGGGVMLVAGDAPEQGDINRLQIPHAYREADVMLRPLRAERGISFAPPWTEQTTQAWLRRFETRS
jgi:hypothetical protein